ncbi:MAG TPA: GGDEF domain-containing protein, partial [Actinoplanes sp.]|nr:GGDEF domain-containing protein [Actinoplanes sp.]
AVPAQTRGAGQLVLLAGSTTGHEFDQAELDTTTALVGQGATAHDNARLFAQVQSLATTDGLTGLYNRRHFTEIAGAQISIARRNHRPLIGMMVDIDHFKKVNDTYGHAVGDDVIRAVAGALTARIREPDVLCRYGGEEFAVIMSEMHGDPAEVAERLRVAVAELTVPTAHGELRVTVSIGVAVLPPGGDLDSVLGSADEALYRAKEAGRNQVCTSGVQDRSDFKEVAAWAPD